MFERAGLCTFLAIITAVIHQMMERIYNQANIQTHSVDNYTYCILKSSFQCLSGGSDAVQSLKSHSSLLHLALICGCVYLSKPGTKTMQTVHANNQQPLILSECHFFLTVCDLILLIIIATACK